MGTQGGDDDARAYEREAWELIRHQLTPLLPWLTSGDCTEIMVNDDGAVWVDTHSRGMHRVDVVMPESVRASIIKTVASAAGKLVTKTNPEVGDVLPVLGARFQGLLPPAAPAPLFVIRLPNTRHIPISEYIASGMLTHAQARKLGHAIATRRNIVVAGGTGSGKTTFCNALLELLGTTNHRVMVIEDTPELRCPAPNTFHARVSRNTPGFGYRDALFVALRFRPDRIVVGELRDGAATLEMLKAWNTGHNGGLTTIHANSAASTLPRIEQLLEEVVERAPRALIAEAVNLVVYLERYAGTDGSSKRRVLDVATVQTGVVGGEYVLEHEWHPSIT